MKKHSLVSFLFLGVVLLSFEVTPGALHASGTYTPPPPPEFRGKAVDPELLKKANLLLSEKKALSEKDIACMSCHDQGRTHPFRRQALMKKKDTLVESINNCLTNQERMAGKPLPVNDEKMQLLQMYFFVKFRLPKE